jgi:hypothetical protein
MIREIEVGVKPPGSAAGGGGIFNYLESYSPGITQRLASDPKVFPTAKGQFSAANAHYQ